MSMSDLPINLYFAKDVQKIDALAIANIPINGYQLMLRAAQAAFIVLQQHWENAKTIAVVCGGGKNGGDGYVLAKLAKKAGLSVTVYSVGEAPSKALEAKQAHADWLAIGEKVIPFQNQQIFADVIVDAILGTGTHFPLPQEISQAISAINNSHCPVFSLDLPSGLDANTGHCEEAVKATLTLTFIAMKVGLLTGKAADLVGKLVFDNLGVTASIYSQVKPCARRIDYQE
ncbi:MAG: NAD(P)H-hydrate epimerase, partial [Candidatus Berkiella sp.]